MASVAHRPGMRDPAAHRRSPINTELLEPQRVAGAIALARRNFDYVIVDLHPSYSPLNRAVFDQADRILVPVTPDLPAIRAVVKLREVADEQMVVLHAYLGRLTYCSTPSRTQAAEFVFPIPRQERFPNDGSCGCLKV